MPLCRYSQAFRALLQLPSSATVEHLPVKGLLEVAREQAEQLARDDAETELPFTAPMPPRVIGDGDLRPLECVTRSLYVACLPDASVHGRSALVEFRDSVLLDFEGR